MTATLNILPERRELDRRSSDGIEVTLSWSPDADKIFVTVVDEAGDSFELAVLSDEALDAFNHPFAYAARPGSVTRSWGPECSIAAC